MIRKAALSASLCLLASCAASSTPIEVARPACPPSLTAEVPAQPTLPDDAGIVRPVDAQERAAVGAFVGAVAELRDYAGEMAGRARTAREWCAG